MAEDYKTLQEQFADADEKLTPIGAPEDSDPSPSAKKEAKKSFAPMRVGLLVLFMMLIVGGVYLVYHGYRRVTNTTSSTVHTAITPNSSLVAATVNPTLSTNRPQVVSQNNTTELANPNSNSSGQVLGGNIQNQDSGGYPCPDALGDTVACLPPWYKP